MACNWIAKIHRMGTLGQKGTFNLKDMHIISQSIKHLFRTSFQGTTNKPSFFSNAVQKHPYTDEHMQKGGLGHTRLPRIMFMYKTGPVEM